VEFGVWSLELESKNTSLTKSEAFAIRIVKLYKYLTEKKKEFVLSKQILRAGTSIGANLAESQCGISRSDWLAKIYIALKECNETMYWLRLLAQTDFLSAKEFDSVYADCGEIKRMLSSSTKTARKDMEKK
jgi:four helix bundle protein